MTEDEYRFVEAFLRAYGKPVLVSDLKAALRQFLMQEATVDQVEHIVDMWASSDA